jgi:hypothetical protein
VQLLYFVEGFVKSRARSQLARAYLSLSSPRAAEAFFGLWMNAWKSFEIPHKVKEKKKKKKEKQKQKLNLLSPGVACGGAFSLSASTSRQ